MKQFCIALLVVLAFFGGEILLLSIYEPKPEPARVTPYSQIQAEQKRLEKAKADLDDDCSIAMCSAFGGGIVGDTMAIQFMNGD